MLAIRQKEGPPVGCMKFWIDLCYSFWYSSACWHRVNRVTRSWCVRNDTFASPSSAPWIGCIAQRAQRSSADFHRFQFSVAKEADTLAVWRPEWKNRIACLVSTRSLPSLKDRYQIEFPDPNTI